MISFGAFLVFLLVLAIVSTYIGIIHHFLKQAGAPEDAVAPQPVEERRPVNPGTLRPANQHAH